MYVSCTVSATLYSEYGMHLKSGLWVVQELKMALFDRSHTIPLYGSILSRFHNKARQWLKVVIFSYSPSTKQPTWKNRLQIFFVLFFATKQDPCPVRWLNRF